MYKTRATQSSFVEEILYKQLPKDKLSKINQLIDRQPFEKIYPRESGDPGQITSFQRGKTRLQPTPNVQNPHHPTDV